MKSAAMVLLGSDRDLRYIFLLVMLHINHTKLPNRHQIAQTKITDQVLYSFAKQTYQQVIKKYVYLKGKNIKTVSIKSQ